MKNIDDKDLVEISGGVRDDNQKFVSDLPGDDASSGSEDETKGTVDNPRGTTASNPNNTDSNNDFTP